MSQRYSIDLDLFKILQECPCVTIKWRVSASRRGFHILWHCEKRTCKTCKKNAATFDDPIRHRRDLELRKPYQRNVLWTVKGRKKAGRWNVVPKN